MRLKRAQIFGFGKWIDTSFDFDNDSFLCFYGENESGKSTLQQFIFYMLFGLPPRKLAPFKPKYSSRIGGTLTIAFPTIGNVTIERVDNHFRILLPDGNIIRDETWLEKQLHGLQRETYRAIYGFSSLDLSKLHEMKKTELSDLLFSVGLTGSTAIYEVERRLQRRLDELFKKSGRKPIVNKQIKKVNDLERNMLEAKKETVTYAEKIKLQATLKTRLSKLEEKLAKWRHSLSITEKMLQFLPQINQLKETEELLQTYENIPLNFPEEGLKRYEQLKDKIVPLQAELNADQKLLQQYEQSISELKDELLDETLYIEITRLIEDSTDFEKVKHQAESLQEEIDETNRTIEQELNDLQVTEEAVVQFDAPFHLETSWQQLIDDEKNLQIEKDYIAEERRLLEQKEKQLKNEYEKHQEKFIRMGVKPLRL